MGSVCNPVPVGSERPRAGWVPRCGRIGRMQIAGSVALVTGGASGLGLATARTLADHDARVVIVDLPSSAGEQQADEIGARFAPADVTSESDVAAAVDLAAGLGELRIVVNCAG